MIDCVKHKKYPIILGGFYRSGTSLVRRIVDAHENIDCPPEIKFFKDFFGHYKNDKLSHIRYFKTAHSMGLRDEELLYFFGNNFIELHELAAKKRNKKRWADKSPENVLYLHEWFELLDGKMLFVFIVRNPLDSISSLNEVGFKKDVPQKFEKKVELFKKFTDYGMNFINENQKTSYIIKYEDLVMNPGEEIEKLFDFVGEGYDDNVLKTFNTSKRISGIEDPKVKERKGIDASSVGRWKQDLNENQVNYIVKNCRSFIDNFDYKQ